MSKDSQLKEQVLKDLARSGLDAKDYRILQLEPLSRDQTDEFVGEPRPSYRIPYFSIDGKRIAYSRVRFLESGNGKGFKKGRHNFRYSQPFNSNPHIYFPPHLDWRTVAKDVDIPIVITEGEKKAAKACKEGVACIALGGVYGFKSSKRLQDLIPEFFDIEWKGREVEICYDSDVMIKSEVRQSLTSLAFELSKSFSPASIDFIFLDAEVAGAKTGLDDFLMARGADDFWELPRQPYRANAKIQLLNQRICYVEAHGRFYDIKAKRFYTSFNQVREAFMNEGEEVVDGKRTSLIIDLWGKHKNRRTVHDVVYEPGNEVEVTEDNDLNAWVPPAVRPRRGKPTKWLDLVHFIFREPEYADWFIQWLAYPLQKPGTKLLTAIFVYGMTQGVGKTFVVDPVMEYVYGKENFYRLSNDDLQSEFNSYAARCQFVVTNEIYFSEMRDRRSMMSKLKDIITREKVTVNEKFQPKVTFMDYTNYYFTSNHPDALVIEPMDRRYFVIEAPTEKLDPLEYQVLDNWVRNEDGAAVISHYLRNAVDLSDFNPKGDALFTPYKGNIIDLSKDLLTEFTEQLLEEPKQAFMHNGHIPDLQLYRSEDLIKLFETNNPRYRYVVTSNKMGRLLDDARIERRKVRLDKDSPQIVLYAMFERGHWRKAKNKEWAKHYLDQHKKYGNRGKLT